VLAGLCRKRDWKRKKVIEEIVSSEDLYCKFLDILSTKFYKPMSAFLSQEQIVAIFSNISSMAPFHKIFAQELAEAKHVRPAAITPHI